LDDVPRRARTVRSKPQRQVHQRKLTAISQKSTTVIRRVSSR